MVAERVPPALRTTTLQYATAAALALALTATLYAPLLDAALFGWDTPIAILTSRVHDTGDLWSLLSREWLQGRQPNVDFYRPVTSLAFTLDHALWDLRPLGYHLTDLALCALTGVLLYALVRALLGPRHGWTGLVATLVWVAHPVQLAVLSVPSRRAEALSVAFVVACLALQARHARPPRQAAARAAATALLAVLAVGAKESGAIVVPLAMTLHAATNAGSARERARAAALASIPTALGALAVLLARSTVLGGVGGHAQDPIGLAGLPDATQRLAGAALHVASWTGPERAWVSWTALAVVAALWTVLWRAARAAERRTTRAALAVLAVWALTATLVTTFAGHVSPWYALALVAPLALLAALALRTGLDALAQDRLALACAALVLPCALVARHLALQLAYPRAAWADATAEVEVFLADLERAVLAAQPGDDVPLRVPTFHPVEVDGAPVGEGALLLFNDSGLQAWVEMTLPEREVVVLRADASVPPRSSGDRSVRLIVAAAR